VGAIEEGARRVHACPPVSFCLALSVIAGLVIRLLLHCDHKNAVFLMQIDDSICIAQKAEASILSNLPRMLSFRIPPRYPLAVDEVGDVLKRERLHFI
jgi:hypothetical protein